ncbi:related to Retrovirus-related POL polyprotein [Ustilago bromivora]|uniref:Related to Retrovirus-related POL polyprotein n=1 Tax=Ustilago bromivora TaxID=307758 RepID=A0A1K0HG80_9BASI|nr:related to Retrovirus-related POL polyprotein [Ustilago bromivora]
MSQFAEQLPKETSRPPIAAWYAFVERVHKTSSNIVTTLSQQARKREAQHITTLQELTSIDIRHGDQNRAKFLDLLAIMHQMDICQANETIKKCQAIHELNMFRPTAWIIPKLESRSFAVLPSICDDQGIYHNIFEKLLTIQCFYTTLFTPKEHDCLSEEASSMLLSSVQCQNSPATRHTCKAPFTLEELCSILSRSQEMSAPGLDGITYPLLHILSNTALEKLCALGNALLRGHHLPDGEPML